MCEICEKEEERALRALRLNCDSSDLDYSGRLLSASSKKPTIGIKRLSFNGQGIKLKGVTSIKLKRESKKALRLRNKRFG